MRATQRTGRTWAHSTGRTVGGNDSSGNKLSVVRSNGPVDSFDVQFSVLEVSHVEQLFGWMEELVPIHEGLQYNGSRVTVVVHGLGGMGS